MRLVPQVVVACLLIATGAALAISSDVPQAPSIDEGEAGGESEAYVYTNADLEPLPSGSDAYFIDPFDGLGWGFVFDVLQMSYARLDADRRFWLASRVTDAHLDAVEDERCDVFTGCRRARVRPYFWHIPTINGIPAPFFYSSRRHDRDRTREPYPWLRVGNPAPEFRLTPRRFSSPVRQVLPVFDSPLAVDPVGSPIADPGPRVAVRPSTDKRVRGGREPTISPAAYTLPQVGSQVVLPSPEPMGRPGAGARRPQSPKRSIAPVRRPSGARGSQRGNRGGR